MFEGYLRPDGLFGCRNLVAVVSFLDLANDVVLRITRTVPGTVAVLTGAGGLSIDPEAARLDQLRGQLCSNPNVGAVLAIGPTSARIDRLARQARDAGRLAGTIALSAQPDSLGAVEGGVTLANRFRAAMAGQARQPAAWGAVRLGLRSSSSSLESALTVNPAVGGLVDHVLASGGSVCFGEVADLAGVADELAARGSTPEVAADLHEAVEATRRTMLALDGPPPDPTPTNLAGGIDTLELKGQGALRRIGTLPIASVFRFGGTMPRTGLHLMAGPGSAAVCLAGLTAAGCTMVVYTVGVTSVTAPAPLTPVVAVGPASLATSRDLDLAVTMPGSAATARLIEVVLATLRGGATAGERHAVPQFILPGLLPPL